MPDRYETCTKITENPHMKRNKSKGSERDLGCQVYFEGRARKTVQSKQPVAADTANERERETARERECVYVCVCIYIYRLTSWDFPERTVYRQCLIYKTRETRRMILWKTL